MSTRTTERSVRTGPRIEAPLTLTTKTPRTLSFLDQFSLWGNLGISLFGPVTGASIAAYTGSLAKGLLATLVGSVLGALVLGGSAVFGSQTGAPAMACMRGLFGRRGSRNATSWSSATCLSAAPSSPGRPSSAPDSAGRGRAGCSSARSWMR